MPSSENIKLQDNERAKELLLDHNCDNCYYYKCPFKPITITCLRHAIQYPTGDDPCFNEGICKDWASKNMSLKKQLVINYNFNGEKIVTWKDVELLIKIIEGEEE